MRIKEVVTLVDTADYSDLYGLIMIAARGEYVDLKNEADIKDLEKTFKKAMDDFATQAFNMGRAYEDR